PPLTVDLPLGQWRVMGTLTELRPSAALRYRASSMKARDRLRAWIAHVVLNATAEDGYPRTTLVYGEKSKFTLSPMEDANEILGDRLALYEQGLRQPLALFPETCWAYAEAAW